MPDIRVGDIVRVISTEHCHGAAPEMIGMIGNNYRVTQSDSGDTYGHPVVELNDWWFDIQDVEFIERTIIPQPPTSNPFSVGQYVRVISCAHSGYLTISLEMEEMANDRAVCRIQAIGDTYPGNRWVSLDGWKFDIRDVEQVDTPSIPQETQFKIGDHVWIVSLEEARRINGASELVKRAHQRGEALEVSRVDTRNVELPDRIWVPFAAVRLAYRPDSQES